MKTPLSNLKEYLNALGKAWKPDGGSQKIKKVWDGKAFNLRHFAEYPYVVMFGDEKEVFYDLLELDDKRQVYSFWKYNQVGNGCMRIMELATGNIVAEWYACNVFGKKDNRNMCEVNYERP